MSRIYGNAVAIDGGEVQLSVQIDGGEISLSSCMDGDVGAFMPVYPESYTGDLVVTPTRETQTLYTEHLTMPGNVIVNPIPPQYGLITYNGSVLTVS